MMVSGKEEKNDAKTKKDSDATSSSDSSSGKFSYGSKDFSDTDDERVANYKLKLGFDPCKLCVCEDCDLRQHCIFIGYVEILAWYIFGFLIFVYAVVSWASEPALYNRSRPHGLDDHHTHRQTHKQRYDYISRLNSKKGAEEEYDHEHQPPRPNLWARAISKYMGKAEVLLRFSLSMTDKEVDLWDEYLQKYLVSIAILASLVVITSTAAGFIVIRGAKYVNVKLLRIHTILAVVTAISSLSLSTAFMLMKCYIQGVFFLLIGVVYGYLSLCSYGLITKIQAGAYKAFRLHGVIYGYEPSFKTKIKPVDSESEAPEITEDLKLRSFENIPDEEEESKVVPVLPLTR